MRARTIALVASLLAMPALAEPPGDATDRPLGDLELPERIDRALRDMMEDVQPRLEGALEYLRSFGAMDDPLHYELPEVLPNGDIIIRRREDAPPFRPEPPVGPDEPPDEPPSGAEDGVRI